MRIQFYFLIVPSVILGVLRAPFITQRAWKLNEYKILINQPLTFDSIPKKQRTLREIIPDDYPVTNTMFERDYTEKNREPKSGSIYSFDKLWYRNDSLKEVLVFELYTDYYRNIIFHFKSNDIPKDLIKEMDLTTEEREPAGEKLKEKYFPGFIKLAHKISSKYLRTNKGFRLGDSKGKAIKTYGKPDKISDKEGIEKCEWYYVGDSFYDPKKDAGKKIALSSYDHQMSMFFRNNILIAIILHNEIP